MRFPLSWLREYVAVRLAGRGARPAAARSRAARSTGSSRAASPDTNGNLGHFLVGRVLEAGKHPNADRLQLCRVDVGEGEPRQIVCGAWNFGAGATVAVALRAPCCPDGRTLGEASCAASLSSGMILSERRARARRRPQRDHGAARRPRAGDAARRRAAAHRDGARDRDGLQPARPDLGVRHCARGLRA